MQGKFRLEWTGSESEEYILEYAAGNGPAKLQGTLEVEGNRKDFGQISRRYWETWIVPKSPIRIRIKQAEKNSWSKWLELEATP